MKEFAFDVDLRAVVRVQAESEEQARQILERIDTATLTEVSLAEGTKSYLFEIDGNEIPLRKENQP